MNPDYLQITPLLGEITWKETPSDSLLSRQLAWLDLIQSDWQEDVLDVRQGFTSVSILWKSQEVEARFMQEFGKLEITPKTLSDKIWEVPVCYGGAYGKDLENLAQTKGLHPKELIELHTSKTYRIHFFGFLPGFMYLNGLPEILHTPRKAMPERAVPAGSVAIGGAQTGIYPKESPGGWHIIGRTPLVLFDAEKFPPVWASPGESLKFFPVSATEMKALLDHPPFPILR